MASVLRFYKNNIAEGKAILIFSIVLAVAARLVFYLSAGASSVPVSDGYLWAPLTLLLQNPMLSLIGSSAAVAGLAILASHINTAHVLIRRRSVLPPAFILLFFSCHPAFMQLSPALLAALLVLYVISTLFATYNTNEKPVTACRVSFMLSLGSLFAPVLLVYIPFAWIMLAIMRSFNFKSLFASVFGFFIIYFPAFSFYLFTDDLSAFYKPFLSVYTLDSFPFFRFDTISWGMLIFFVIFLGIIIGNNYIDRHKDKIRVRAFLFLLSFITILAILFFLFLNISPDVNLYVAIGTGTLLLAHFFALIERRSGVILFYIFMLLYFLVYILSFMTIL
jgi:hypothetical protein